LPFDFALWSEGQVPVTLVREEAHRYVPANSTLGFEPCKRAIAKIAKEGRKYGASLCIVTQRPAEIDPTILSQCNTVFALRMSNDKDQQIVQSAVSDTGSGLLEFLPALGQREAIAFGDGVSLPVRIKFDEMAKENLPRSSTARFSEKWQTSVGDEDFLEQVVERWRTAGNAGYEGQSQTSMMLESYDRAHEQQANPHAGMPNPAGPMPAHGQPGMRQPVPANTRPSGSGNARLHSRSPAAAENGEDPRNLLRRKSVAATAAPAAEPAPTAGSGASALQSLRDRLRQKG